MNLRVLLMSVILKRQFYRVQHSCVLDFEHWRTKFKHFVLVGQNLANTVCKSLKCCRLKSSYCELQTIEKTQTAKFPIRHLL